MAPKARESYHRQKTRTPNNGEQEPSGHAAQKGPYDVG